MELNEMAYTKSIAAQMCRDIGKPFIKHFHKCMEDLENNNMDRFHHHACEMQSWWNDVRTMKLSYNNKKLSVDQLINWFFTAGSDIEEMIDVRYQDLYEKFILDLIKYPNTRLEYTLQDIYFND